MVLALNRHIESGGYRQAWASIRINELGRKLVFHGNEGSLDPAVAPDRDIDGYHLADFGVFGRVPVEVQPANGPTSLNAGSSKGREDSGRSEEHTSELQSQ